MNATTYWSLVVVAVSSFAVYAFLTLTSILSRKSRSSRDVFDWKDARRVGALETDNGNADLKIRLNSGVDFTCPRSQVLTLDGRIFLIHLDLKGALENLDRLQIVGSRLDDVERMYFGGQITREKMVELASESFSLGVLNEVVSSLSSINTEVFELIRVKYDVSKEMAALKVAFDAKTINRGRYNVLISDLSSRYNFVTGKISFLEGLGSKLNESYKSVREKIFVKEMEDSRSSIKSVKLDL